MGHMEMPAQWIGQRMHRRHRGVGEGHAGQHGAEQHVATGFLVLRGFTHCAEIGTQQLQAFARQGVGNEILQAFGRVGLDAMHHGIDTRGGRHVLRQAQGQVRVQHRTIGQQLRGDHAFLFRHAGGDDGDRGDFRAGAGRGRRQHQRQALAFDHADAVHLA